VGGRHIDLRKRKGNAEIPLIRKAILMMSRRLMEVNGIRNETAYFAKD